MHPRAIPGAEQSHRLRCVPVELLPNPPACKLDEGLYRVLPNYLEEHMNQRWELIQRLMKLNGEMLLGIGKS
jgi:hypothetical protein